MGPESDSIHDLRKEVSQLRFLVISFLALGLLLLTLVNLATISMVPRFEKTLESILGAKDKLPGLTKLVIQYSRSAGGMGPYGILISIYGITFIALLMGSGTRSIPLLALFVMMLLAVHWVTVSVPMVVPFQGVVQSAAERT